MSVQKAAIVQELIIDDDTIDKLAAAGVPVNIYNSNSGSIYAQNNGDRDAPALVESLFRMYKDGVGLLSMLKQAKKLYIGFALSECKSGRAAAERLSVSHDTVYGFIRYHREVLPDSWD